MTQDVRNVDDGAQRLPLIALRDIVIFPSVMIPVFVNRDKSLKALELVKTNNLQHVLFVTQKQSVDNPTIDDLYKVGVIAKVIQSIKLPNNTSKLTIEAIHRVKLTSIFDDGFFEAEYEILSDKLFDGAIDELNSVIANVIQWSAQYMKINKKINTETLNIVTQQDLSGHVLNIIASQLVMLPLDIKQYLLEELDIIKRAQVLIDYMSLEVVKSNIDKELQDKIKKRIEKTQRDYYLQEQLKVIQSELDNNGAGDRLKTVEFEKKIKSLKLPKEAKDKAESELKKLKFSSQSSAETALIWGYLDFFVSLPWNKSSSTKSDIIAAELVLNEAHFGLDKVKERIIEYLTVVCRSKKIRGPILCLIGPPGVGKTSLVLSIAKAIGRKYAKFALGGLRDEAEIRGHRKTYLGAMPGKPLFLLKQAKINNPVILLDEIDKMGYDSRGDPSSALLEILDPEQNKHFVDHYLEIAFDLSKVMFVATANSYDGIPRPLLDRMEIINISGYVEQEKLEIAKYYLIKKQLDMHGLRADELSITDASIIHLIRYYTKESGVRGLEREIGSLCRKVLKKILSGDATYFTIDALDLQEYLGSKKYKFGTAEVENQIGAVTGLAYTELGGDLLTIEASSCSGKGNITSTGRLGAVMIESIQIANSCFCAKAAGLGVKYEKYKYDLHLHVPEGAIPKDGPSAGAAIYTAIASLTMRKAVRSDIAMTGEITLRGKILGIGGLREKLLAASRGGIKLVLIPEENVKDLINIPDYIKNNLQILSVSNVDQLLNLALI